MYTNKIYKQIKAGTNKCISCLFLLMLIFCSNVQAKTPKVKYSSLENKGIIELSIDNMTDYKIDNQNDKIIISFNQPYAELLSDISKQLPNFASEQEVSNDKKSIIINTPKTLTINSYWKGEQLNIEFSHQDKTLLQKSIDNKNKTINVRYGVHDTFGRLVFDFNFKPLYSITQESDKTIISFMSEVNLNLSAASSYPDAGLISTKPNNMGGMDVTVPSKIINSFDNKNKLVLDIPLTDEISPNKNIPVDTTTNQRISQSSELSTPQMIPNKKAGKIGSLSFSWNIPVSLSVFNREDYLWIAFDHRQKIDIDDLIKNSSQLISEIVQLPHPSATVLRLKPKENVKAAIRSEGLLWVVDLFTKEAPNYTKNMPIFTEYNSLRQPYLFIPTTAAGNIISFIDPEIGDMITTAPTAEASTGLTSSYIYPDFDLLSSLQGIALVSKTNDIIVNRGNTGLSIKAMNRGLNISADLDKLKRHQLLNESIEGNLFNFETMTQLLNQDFNTALSQLNKDIIEAPDNQKIRTRVELAKYYVSKGLGTEALATLDSIKRLDSEISKSEPFYALHGAANFLARRYDEAIEDFSYGKLPNNNEAVFWRTLASSAKEFTKEDNIILLSFISLIRDYPQELKERIALIGAETAIKAGDDISAQNFIDILKTSENQSENRRANLGYLIAKNLVLQGYPRNAIREYNAVARSGSQKYSALARKEMIMLEYTLRAIKPDKAINEYERLRYTWGEKSFKQDLLDKLSDFYIADKDYYNALKTMQSSLLIANDEQKAKIINKMIKTFENVYLDDQSESGSALKSLALYEDFEWLAPKSKKYNEIIRRLADRLVAVDLLDRAAKLLEAQLNQQDLDFAERSKVGTRLALINLFNNENEMALKILEETENPNAAPAIKAHRKIIKAKALSNLNREDEALLLLKDDWTKNGILLKSEIYWNAGQWGEASDTIRYLIETPVKNKPLSSEQIGYILDWATALKKAGKETVIVRLRNKFMPYFENTKYYSAFSILTNTLESDTINIKAINQAIDEISAFSNFTKIYNDSLKNTSLSKTIE